MDTDLALAIGLAVLCLSAPSIVSAISDGRAPRTAMLTLLIGGGMTLYALTQKPGGYRVDDVPGVIIKVIADFV